MDIKRAPSVKNTEDILVTVVNGVQKVVFNRPKKRNAITISMYKELTNCLYESSKNPNVHTLVLTGNGDFFSSGNDVMDSILKASNSTGDISEELLTTFKKFVDAVITYPKLLIAVVNGPAVGIATTILGLVDMAFASEKAYFYAPFTNLALCAEGCSTYTFPRIMGTSKAGEVLYLGYKMSAAEAEQCGLISKVYKHEQMDEVWSYIYRISSLSIQSILATKRLMKKWDVETLLRVNAEEVKELSKAFASPEYMEKISQFLSRKSKM